MELFVKTRLLNPSFSCQDGEQGLLMNILIENIGDR
ncbi:hypothetical protein GC56T2_1371 [Geobacillus sp. C56-T2]|nr:hypothetical protein GC56T2_1371 [Geobacillus sp. C56-T2]